MTPERPGVRWLESLIDYEKRTPSKYDGEVFSIDGYERLLEKLGSPHLSGTPTVQILGTDGKGSTLAFLETLLGMRGGSTCSFVSPHLFSLRERFRLNGVSVGISVIDRCLERVRLASLGNRSPTFFEALNAAFWLWVVDARPDFVLLETGLGGRLDTTTVSRPVLQILTRLDRDHFKLLGPTMDRIAWEKTAAIKRDVPCVIAPQSPFLLESIRNRLSTRDRRTLFVDEDYRWEILSRSTAAWRVSLAKRGEPRRQYDLGLLGDHQAENLAAAVAAFEELAPSRHPPRSESTTSLFPDWPCRCMVLENSSGEDWILDGSHTAMAGQALRRFVDHIAAPGKSLHFHATSSRERFPWCYLRGLVRREDILTLVDHDHPRLWRATDLANALEEAGWSNRESCPPLRIASAEEALDRQDQGSELRIFCGSLFWVGAVYRSRHGAEDLEVGFAGT